MSRHSDHLPPRRHLNKAVQTKNELTGKDVDKDTLKRLTRGQGSETKKDAKRARQGDRD